MASQRSVIRTDKHQRRDEGLEERERAAAWGFGVLALRAQSQTDLPYPHHTVHASIKGSLQYRPQVRETQTGWFTQMPTEDSSAVASIVQTWVT